MGCLVVAVLKGTFVKSNPKSSHRMLVVVSSRLSERRGASAGFHCRLWMRPSSQTSVRHTSRRRVLEPY